MFLLLSNLKIFRRIFLIFFLIFAQNIDGGYTLEPPRQGGSLEPPRQGGSNEYPQTMFQSKNKKYRYTPAYPSFAIQKWGSRGYLFRGHVFLMIQVVFSNMCTSDQTAPMKPEQFTLLNFVLIQLMHICFSGALYFKC